jgi:hypothetical protein
MSYYSQSPYGDRRYGGALSFTQGVLDAYREHEKMRYIMGENEKDRQYRQSILDMSQKRLGLAERREERMSQPRPVSSSEKINSIFHRHLQNMSPAEQAKMTQRRFSGSPRTTLAIDDLQAVIDGDLDNWQRGQAGGMTESTDGWGEATEIPNPDFSPDANQLEALIEEMASTYATITGLPTESLSNLARRSVMSRWPGYKPPQAQGSGQAMFTDPNAYDVPNEPLIVDGADPTRVAPDGTMFQPGGPTQPMFDPAEQPTGNENLVLGLGEGRFIPDDTRLYMEPPPLSGMGRVWNNLPDDLKQGVWKAYQAQGQKALEQGGLPSPSESGDRRQQQDYIELIKVWQRLPRPIIDKIFAILSATKPERLGSVYSEIINSPELKPYIR